MCLLTLDVKPRRSYIKRKHSVAKQDVLISNENYKRNLFLLAFIPLFVSLGTCTYVQYFFDAARKS